MTKTTTYLLLILFVLTGCELYKQDEYTKNYVVESYLIAGERLPEVRLSTTIPVDRKYDFQDAAVSNAKVEVRLLNEDSTVAETYHYRSPNSRYSEAGIYKPLSKSLVKQKRLYQLYITTADDKIISSTTYVPGDFETSTTSIESYTYQSSEQVKITVDPSFYPGRQTYYIFTVNAIGPATENLTPFYQDLVHNQDNTIENYYVNSSGIINEENYEQNKDGMITLKVPWLAVAFYGTNDIVVNAIDDNMYDFLRSQEVQTGGTNLSPGEIQNIHYNISGGIGIFGSMASDTNRVIISRP